MKLCHRRIGALVLFLTLPVWSSFAQLNSLVARVNQPRGPIPAECEQGLSPAPPLRVEVRDIEPPRNEPAEPIAPPSGALRTALQETQIALTRNDRPAFNTALARTKALLLTYPGGAERRTAEDIARLHDTAARLWDAQYEAPFFSESDPEFALVRDLPGYADAMRRNTLTDDNERRFYPTAESRDFVAQVAGERLQRLGIRGATRPVREDRAREQRMESPRTTAPRATTPRATTPRTAAPRATSAPRRSASSAPARTTRKPAAATPAPRSPNPTVPPAAAAAPGPAPAQTPEQTASSPAAGELPVPAPAGPPAETTALDTLPDPAPATTAAPVVDTAASAVDPAVTSTAVVPAVPSTSRGRSVFLPAILILIGLGVLIVLFRASK